MENKKSKFSEIAAGDYLSETQYYRVLRNTGTMLEVENERGFPFAVAKGIVEEGIYTANQFDAEKEVLVTRTELIRIFGTVNDTVFKVCFNKQPTADAINEAIASANRGKILPIAELKKVVKTAYKGEERVLTGYLVSTETGFGRSMVIDLEADRSKSTADWDSRLKQVDHRTLNWLVFKNVKYSVKK